MPHAEIARAHGAIVKREPRQGKGNVVRQMFRDIEADYYIMVDGDDTYPAESARALLKPLIDDEADMTVGDRLSNGSYGEENDRAFHGFGNDLVRWLIKFIYGYAFDDVMTGYRAFNRTFVKTMPVLSSGFQIETELSIHAVDKRWRIVDVPIEYRDRPEGSESNFHVRGRREGAHGHRIAVPREAGRSPSSDGSFRCSSSSFGLTVGVPVVFEFFQTGLVPKFPSTVLASGLVSCGVLSSTAGAILDTVARGHRKMCELEVYRDSTGKLPLTHDRRAGAIAHRKPLALRKRSVQARGFLVMHINAASDCAAEISTNAPRIDMRGRLRNTLKEHATRSYWIQPHVAFTQHRLKTRRRIVDGAYAGCHSSLSMSSLSTNRRRSVDLVPRLCIVQKRGRIRAPMALTASCTRSSSAMRYRPCLIVALSSDSFDSANSPSDSDSTCAGLRIRTRDAAVVRAVDQRLVIGDDLFDLADEFLLRRIKVVHLRYRVLILRRGS